MTMATYPSFEECWQAICEKLSPRPRLYCWSVAGRAKGFFGVLHVGHEGISVQTKNEPRFVHRRDFEMLFTSWPAYRAGKIQRHKLNFVVNTTYVLSIFHWLELQ
jgi:hypothetical protein